MVSASTTPSRPLLRRDAGDTTVPDNDALHLGVDELGAERGKDGLGEEVRVDLRSQGRSYV